MNTCLVFLISDHLHPNYRFIKKMVRKHNALLFISTAETAIYDNSFEKWLRDKLKK
jgi:hypothetical protein